MSDIFDHYFDAMEGLLSGIEDDTEILEYYTGDEEIEEQCDDE